MTHSGWSKLLASADVATTKGAARRAIEPVIRARVAEAGDATSEVFALLATTGTHGLAFESDALAFASATAMVDRITRARGRSDVREAGDEGRLDADTLSNFLPKLAKAASSDSADLAHCIFCHAEARLGRTLEEQLVECGTGSAKSAESTHEVLPDAIKRAAAKVAECRSRGRAAASNAIQNLAARGDLTARELESLSLVLGVPLATRIAPGASPVSAGAVSKGSIKDLPDSVLGVLTRPSVSSWVGEAAATLRGRNAPASETFRVLGRLLRTGEIHGALRTDVDAWLAALPPETALALAGHAGAAFEQAESAILGFVAADPLLRGTVAEKFDDLGIARRATSAAAPTVAALWDAIVARDDGESFAVVLSLFAMVKQGDGIDDAVRHSATDAAHVDAVIDIVGTDLAALLPNGSPDTKIRALLDRVAGYAKPSPLFGVLVAVRAAKHVAEGGLRAI